VVEGAELVPMLGMGIAAVMARRGADMTHLAALLGISAMPVARALKAGSGEIIIGTGPEMWLVISPDAAPDWGESLAERLAGVASVSDQSGGYALYSLRGAKARQLLQKGAFIDLHPDAFGRGSAATTVIAHAGVILWQTEEEAPAFELALFRSFQASLEHWFTVALAAMAAAD
jgi:heterotetrameric sarcosine oxidase gamma subunit